MDFIINLLSLENRYDKIYMLKFLNYDTSEVLSLALSIITV